MIDVAEPWQYRALLLDFVRRDLKVRYKNSFLGFAWSLLNPLCQMLVYVFVFRYLNRGTVPNYSVKVLVVMMPWIFFQQALMDGASSVAQQVFLLKKVYFPRILVPLATLGSNLVHFLLGLSVMAVYFLAVGVTPQWGNIPLALMGLIIQLAFMLGMVLLTSSICVYYNDIKFMLGTIVQMWFFLSPILIPADRALHGIAENLPPIFRTLYLLNPMAPSLIAYRSLIPEESVPGGGNNYMTLMYSLVPNLGTYFAIAALVAVVLLAAGIAVFGRLQWHFAEQA